MNSDALNLPLNGSINVEKGISSKLYEYQAAEKPILCCSNGMSGKYIQYTKSGVVIDPGNSNMLAEKIVFLKNNPEISKSFGLNGRHYVENFFSINKIGERLIKLVNN